MSTGQRPRWRLHFHRMKERCRGRVYRRTFYVIQFDDDGPVWPPRDRDDTTNLRRYPHPRSGRHPRQLGLWKAIDR